jgi:hypothetical protein
MLQPKEEIMRRLLVITLALAVGLFAAGTALAADPVPDVKANGSDGPVEITPADTVTCTISLDPMDQAGKNADWFFFVNTPNGFYSRVGNGWVGPYVVAVAYQGPLVPLTDRFVFSTSGLGDGDYDCIFAVDLLMDGRPTPIPGLHFYDVVDVNVTASP